MSFKAYRWAESAPTRHSSDQLVLLGLASFADEHGACWPGLDSLASRTRLSRRTVQRRLVALELEGLVKITRGVGRGNVSQYQLMLPDLDQSTQLGSAEKVSPTTVPHREKVSSTTVSHREKVSSAPVKGVTVSTESKYLEPTTTTGTVARARDDRSLVETVLTAGDVTRRWVDTYRSTHPGLIETRRQKSQVASEAKDLLEAGNDPQRILAAAASAATGGWSTLQREVAMRASNGSDLPPGRHWDPDRKVFFERF